MGRKKDKREDLREVVRTAYSRIAKRGGSCCGTSTGTCTGTVPEAVAAKIGYNAKELAGLPEGANMGLSCGNPTALAGLKPGDIALDLGCGGGLDVFLAARKVGPTGRVIGVDMTPEMITKARRSIASFKKRNGLDNVEFRLAEIECLPVPDASVDVVISNCVINLSPDKSRVWQEIARVLKPGGRVAVSDLALVRPLPRAIRKSALALTGCIAGAVLIEETRKMAEAAGLADVELRPEPGYVDNLTEWNDPLYRKIRKHLPKGRKMSDYVASLYVTARKPVRTGGFPGRPT